MKEGEKFKEAFIEAESFFAAFKYISALSFEKVKFSQTSRFMGICRAMEVNHIFAIEMFLKCISIIKTNQYKPIHSLSELFKGLPITTQKEITEHYNNNYKSVDVDFIMEFKGETPPPFLQILENHKDDFLETRYIFSREKNRYGIYKLHYVLMTLREMCLKYKPQLETEVYALD